VKGLESSFLANQECIQHKLRNSQLGSEAEVSVNVKGSSRRVCLKLLIKEVKSLLKNVKDCHLYSPLRKRSSEDCK
jgi:hypothetical protein